MTANNYDPTLQVGLGLVTFFGFFAFLKYFYRALSRYQSKRRDYLREAYRGIYRVKASPVSQWTWCSKNIKMNDYGWEMESNQRDNLIYLHGLNDQWGVVWIGGFRREDLEYIGLKPVSQYDWRDFEYDGPKPVATYCWGRSKAKTPCPFPANVNSRKNIRWQYPV